MKQVLMMYMKDTLKVKPISFYRNYNNKNNYFYNILLGLFSKK